MPVLRIFVLLVAIGTIGPLWFMRQDANADFLIPQLGLQRSVPAAMALLAVGSIALCAGCLVQRLRPIRDWTNGPEMNFAFGMVLWAATILVTLALLGGSPAAIARSIHLLDSRTRGAIPGQSLLFIFFTVGVFQVGLLALYAIDRPTGPRMVGAAGAVLVTAVLAFAMGSRLQAVLALLTPALAAGARGRLRPALMAPPALLGVAIVYMGDIIRRAAQGRDVREGGGILETFTSSFSQIDPMAVAVELAERVPTTALQSIKVVFLWLMPQVIVAHKPLPAPVVARYVYFSDNGGGITLGMFGEYYYYFGIIGMIILAFMTGWALSQLARIAVQGVLLPHYVAFMAVINLLFSSLRDGFFNDIMSYVLLAVLFLVNAAAGALLQASARRATGVA
ncbi:MAG: oligosaccharide repeat unit polymerase [Caulobacteraceae bacterium]|nr:oligosaccharide repeat unit polymerase [Caulobacteraceae bacterium]